MKELRSWEETIAPCRTVPDNSSSAVTHGFVSCSADLTTWTVRKGGETQSPPPFDPPCVQSFHSLSKPLHLGVTLRRDSVMCVRVCFSRVCPCDPVDCSPPGSSVQGILQARMLEWVAMPSSRASSPPRDRTCVSSDYCIAGGFFYHRATKETLIVRLVYLN